MNNGMMPVGEGRKGRIRARLLSVQIFFEIYQITVTAVCGVGSESTRAVS